MRISTTIGLGSASLALTIAIASCGSDGDAPGPGGVGASNQGGAGNQSGGGGQGGTSSSSGGSGVGGQAGGGVTGGYGGFDCLEPAPSPALRIATNGGDDFTTTGGRVVLTGAAPDLVAGAAVESITVNGSARGVSFDPASLRWSYHGPTSLGTSAYTVAAHSSAGASEPVSIDVTLSTEPPAEPMVSYGSGDHTVGAWLFSWFTADPNWECTSPWWPVDGFLAWDGSVAWAKGQLRDMMDANIDVVGVQFDTRDEALDWGVRWTNVRHVLQAIRELWDEGYRPPRVLPFVDTAIVNVLYRNEHGVDLDVSATAGRLAFYEYVRTFMLEAASQLGPRLFDAAMAHYQDRPMVAFWHTDTDSIVGASNAFVLDLKARFQTDFGVTPYVIGHPNHWSQWAATDEVTLMFGPPAHFHQGGRDGAGKETINVTPGFWNPISNDWYLPRQGGVHYDSAWSTALGRKAQAEHLYIDSWNETGEGSGIFEALQSSYTSADAGSCGSWIYRHDDSFAADSTRHYIDVTAAQAAAWNDRPDDDAVLLAHDLPTTLEPGERRLVTLVWRNDGDRAWSMAEGDALVVQSGGAVVDEASAAVGAAHDELDVYGGLFRGRPRAFTFELRAPCSAGPVTVSWQMGRNGAAFGPLGSITFEVQ